MALDLLVAADRYDVPNLAALCQRSVARSMTNANAAETLVKAHMHCLDALERFAIRFIKDNDVSEVSKTEEWAAVMADPDMMKKFFAK